MHNHIQQNDAQHMHNHYWAEWHSAMQHMHNDIQHNDTKHNITEHKNNTNKQSA